MTITPITPTPTYILHPNHTHACTHTLNMDTGLKSTHCVCQEWHVAAGTACLCCVVVCWICVESCLAASKQPPDCGCAPRASPPEMSITQSAYNIQRHTIKATYRIIRETGRGHCSSYWFEMFNANNKRRAFENATADANWVCECGKRRRCSDAYIV